MAGVSHSPVFQCSTTAQTVLQIHTFTSVIHPNPKLRAASDKTTSRTN